MVKKRTGTDDCFNQQSILLTLPAAYVSPLIMSSTYMYVARLVNDVCGVISHMFFSQFILK